MDSGASTLQADTDRNRDTVSPNGFLGKKMITNPDLRTNTNKNRLFTTLAQEET